MMNRRKFIKQSTLASSAVFAPQFLKAFPNSNLSNTGKTLVVIQWSGGNDGLNTFVPYRNDFYYKNRPEIGIKKEEVLKVTDEMGFNPVMKGMKNLYDEGYLSILNSVGYPNPERSHFRSMDIWQTGSASDEYWQTGWLGRYLDHNCANKPPHYALEVDDTLSLAMKGNTQSGFAVGNIGQLKKTTSNGFHKNLLHHHDHDHEENVAYLYKTMIGTHESAKYLHGQSKIYKSKANYPKTGFAKDLKQVAELIVSNAETKIYYVNLTGFDTHVNQKSKQEKLLKIYSEAIKVFVDDLKANDKFSETLILTFSEFGRRVKQNASKGTDHGTANNLYIIGENLKKAGVYNTAPDLKNLMNGDLVFDIDFRQVYTTVLQNWLQVDATPILGQKFDMLKFI